MCDGWAVAEYMKQEHPWAYEVLSKVTLSSHASGNEDVSISPAWNYPVINSTLHGPQIRWNNSDRGTMTWWASQQEMETWYEAARIWNRTIHSKDFLIETIFEPGTALSKGLLSEEGKCLLILTAVFNNWRMLHGRTPFTGQRRLCGGYSKFGCIQSSEDSSISQSLNAAKLIFSS